jgi:hypothetical protein
MSFQPGRKWRQAITTSANSKTRPPRMDTDGGSPEARRRIAHSRQPIAKLLVSGAGLLQNIRLSAIWDWLFVSELQASERLRLWSWGFVLGETWLNFGYIRGERVGL